MSQAIGDIQRSIDKLVCLLGAMTPVDPRDRDGYCGYCRVGGTWAEHNEPRRTWLVHRRDCEWVAAMAMLDRDRIDFDCCETDSADLS